MNLEKVDDLLKRIKLLSPEEIDFLQYQLFNKNNSAQETVIPNCCEYCGSIKFHKHGKRDGKQRYKCYDCKKTFTTTNSIKYLHSSHISKFNKFIECTINNLSLRRTAEICGISVSCAFEWRHKLLFLISQQLNNESITGLVEMDEIYFKNSLKGNHKNEINCKSRTDGHVPYLKDRVGLSKDKICITTAIDRTKT